MRKNESKIDLAVLRIDIPDNGKPVISIPEHRTTLQCPNCKGESFSGYTNDYGLHRVCTTCSFEMDLGGQHIDSSQWYAQPVFQPISKEQVESDEADRIAEVRQNDYYSGANRDFWSSYNEWEINDY